MNLAPEHDDIITLAEADSLGLSDPKDEGLGFVGPSSAFKKVNKQILEHINSGELIWRKPWRDGYRVKGVTYGPQNYETMKPYRGYNAWIIGFINMQLGENNEYFLTEKQIRERGGKLKKGAVRYPVSAFVEGEKEIVLESGKKIKEEYAGWVHYDVFPLAHTIGVKPIKRRENKEAPDEIVVDAETLIERMPKRPEIKHGGNEAYYSQARDFVQMPAKKAFPQQKKYYSVLFHELIHSTGHKKRVGRDLVGKFGSKPYAFEELIAELGAAYLCGVCEIEYHTLKNSAAYLKGWSKTLSMEMAEDPKFLFRAVYSATKAAKYIIGQTLEKKGEVREQLSGDQSPAAVEMLARYVDLHKNETTRKDLQVFLYDLQMAIRTKLIRKDDVLASKVVHIQNMLVKALNSDATHFYIEITKIKEYQEALQGVGILPALVAAAAGEGVKLVVSKFFKKKDEPVSGLGNVDVPAGPEEPIQESVTVGEVAKDPAPVQVETPRVEPKKEVMRVSDALAGEFDLLGLDGEYLNLIGEACRPTSIFLYGPGGSGKSTLTLLFSNYLAKQGNRVLYVAGEQYGTPVFKKMLLRLNIQDFENFVIAKNINSEDPGQFDVMVIDSKDSLNFQLDQFIALREKYPKLSFVVLSQATKDGGFTGSEKWRNEVDTMVYCESLRAYTNRDKNRWGGSYEMDILSLVPEEKAA